MAEADPFSGLSGVGAEYQLGRELDTADCCGSQELDPHRQSRSGTKSRGDSIDHRKLSTNQATRARISVRRTTWPGKSEVTTSIRPYTHGLGRTLIAHNLKSSCMSA